MTTESPSAPPIAPARQRCCRPTRVIILLLTLGIMLTWLYGYTRWPTGPASGEGVMGTLPTVPPGKTIFRVATFNMHSGVGDDDVFNIHRTIDQVREPDVCALQEVRGYWRGPVSNQAQLLADATGHGWLFCPTERQYWHDEFGNGLLTRLPVENWVRVPLPIEPVHSGRRNVAIARIRFGQRLVPVVFAHIDREKDQANQLMMVWRLFESLQSPSLLLADLNAEAKNAQVRELLSIEGVHDCIAESSADSESHGRIDWILARGFKTVTGGHLQNGASDHPLYWADVELNSN